MLPAFLYVSFVREPSHTLQIFSNSALLYLPPTPFVNGVRADPGHPTSKLFMGLKGLLVGAATAHENFGVEEKAEQILLALCMYALHCSAAFRNFVLAIVGALTASHSLDPPHRRPICFRSNLRICCCNKKILRGKPQRGLSCILNTSFHQCGNLPCTLQNLHPEDQFYLCGWLKVCARP